MSPGKSDGVAPGPKTGEEKEFLFANYLLRSICMLVCLALLFFLDRGWALGMLAGFVAYGISFGLLARSLTPEAIQHGFNVFKYILFMLVRLLLAAVILAAGFRLGGNPLFMLAGITLGLVFFLNKK